MDCYRHWEHVLLKAIPIVKNSTLWPLFEDISCYLLEDWSKPVTKEQVGHKNHVLTSSENDNDITFQFLKFMPKPPRRRMAFAQYWFDRINADREEFLGGETFSHLFRQPREY